MSDEIQDWRFQLDGRSWGDGALERFDLAPEKIELIRGRLFCSDEERLAMIGLLLENVGLRAVVRLGDPEMWKAAVRELD